MTRRIEVDDDGRILLDGRWIARVAIGEPERDGRPNVRIGAVRLSVPFDDRIDPDVQARMALAEETRLSFTSWQVDLDEWEAHSPAARR